MTTLQEEADAHGDTRSVAQELRPLLQVRAQKKRFLKTFSTFNHHAYFNDQAKIEAAKDAISDAESKIVLLLNTVVTARDGATPTRMIVLGRMLLPLSVEDGVDFNELSSHSHPRIAELGAVLVELQKNS